LTKNKKIVIIRFVGSFISISQDYNLDCILSQKIFEIKDFSTGQFSKEEFS